jgi:hypothetical protein
VGLIQGLGLKSTSHPDCNGQSPVQPRDATMGEETILTEAHLILCVMGLRARKSGLIVRSPDSPFLKKICNYFFLKLNSRSPHCKVSLYFVLRKVAVQGYAKKNS